MEGLISYISSGSEITIVTGNLDQLHATIFENNIIIAVLVFSSYQVTQLVQICRSDLLLKIPATSALGNPEYLLITRSAAGGISPMGSSSLCISVTVPVVNPDRSAAILAWLSSLSRFVQASDAAALAMAAATLASINARSASIFRCSRSNLVLLLLKWGFPMRVRCFLNLEGEGMFHRDYCGPERLEFQMLLLIEEKAYLISRSVVGCEKSSE